MASLKRRNIIKAFAAASAVPAAIAQQAPAPAPVQPGLGGPAQPVDPGRASMELPKLETTVPDVAGEVTAHFFPAAQFAALRKVCDILMPALNGQPGALDAQAPEFLDFLISQSPADRQQLYRAGLDRLNSDAAKTFKKTFAELEPSQADTVLAPLREPWTYELPKDPLSRFLRAIKQDVRTATQNSREFSTASASAGRRNMFGGGLYWYPID